MSEAELNSLSSLAIYSLTGIIIVALILSTIAAIFAIRHSPEEASNSIKEFFKGGNALKILTVFAVLITATYLALAEQLTDAAIALLSSVSGYVLGAMKSGNE